MQHARKKKKKKEEEEEEKQKACIALFVCLTSSSCGH